MKKVLLSILLIGALLESKAQQIPNPGFETWGFGFIPTYTMPSGYITSSYYPLLAGKILPSGQENNVSKSTDSHSGTYAMKMVAYRNDTTVVAGIAGTLKLELTSIPADATELMNSIKPGFPYTGRPAELAGYYKYNHGLDPDSAVALVMLLKSNPTNRFDLIGYGISLLPDAGSYTPFTVPISYSSSANPDTAIIAFSTTSGFSIDNLLEFNFNLNASEGAVLFIDDIAFNGNLTGIASDKRSGAELSAFPNPASTFVTLMMGSATETVELSVYDAMGKQVDNRMVELVSGKYSLDLGAYASGVYAVQVSGRSATATKKIVVSK